MQLDLFEKPMTDKQWMNMRLKNMEEQQLRAQRAQFAMINSLTNLISKLQDDLHRRRG